MQEQHGNRYAPYPVVVQAIDAASKPTIAQADRPHSSPRRRYAATAYEDRYERRDGTWYFVGRSHLLFYGLEVPERPLDQEPARWPHSPVGLGTIPYDWPSWQSARNG